MLKVHPQCILHAGLGRTIRTLDTAVALQPHKTVAAQHVAAWLAHRRISVRTGLSAHWAQKGTVQLQLGRERYFNGQLARLTPFIAALSHDLPSLEDSTECIVGTNIHGCLQCINSREIANGTVVFM